MASLTIITGAPGAGKTTLAARLAASSPRGAHVVGDAFYRFLAHPIDPTLPESRHQNTVVIKATVRAAAALAAAGYDVYLDGIFGPWFLPVIAAELQTLRMPVAYVVLRVGLDQALQRTRGRPDFDEITVRHMHAAFSNLENFAGHSLETLTLEGEELVDEFWRRRPSCLLDLGAVARNST